MSLARYKTFPRSSDTAVPRQRCASAEGVRQSTPSDQRAFSPSGVLGEVRSGPLYRGAGALASPRRRSAWQCRCQTHPARRACLQGEEGEGALDAAHKPRRKVESRIAPQWFSEGDAWSHERPFVARCRAGRSRPPPHRRELQGQGFPLSRANRVSSVRACAMTKTLSN